MWQMGKVFWAGQYECYRRRRRRRRNTTLYIPSEWLEGRVRHILVILWVQCLTQRHWQTQYTPLLWNQPAACNILKVKGWTKGTNCSFCIIHVWVNNVQPVDLYVLWAVRPATCNAASLHTIDIIPAAAPSAALLPACLMCLTWYMRRECWGPLPQSFTEDCLLLLPLQPLAQ